MMTKAEIEKLAIEAANRIYDSSDLGSIGGRRSAPGVITRAIEQALATVPRLDSLLVDTVVMLINDANWGDYVPTKVEQEYLERACAALRHLTPPDPPKPFTVLLVCPDYTTDDFGHDTYLAHVEAQNQKEAVYLARVQAWKDRDIDPEDEDFDPNCLNDYFVSLICEGHINDIKED